ncbi:acyltransferase [Ktedonosporobacter rubrisoli]|uniref:Acyltransferase n=1 Tax=Ktedonosporobacter rubrisoli TaxID=2509675 RepID=A0A4P6K3H4_KTERU|nr:acyltransferase family protein [Ktedonosporobacter rubrisoli]QBD82739.1 acyltransferase [Ktedonosporobacter rubrisoli]
MANSAQMINKKTEGETQAEKRKDRLHYVDNLRVYLTCLVILHHLAMTYSGTPGWYYMETTKDAVTTLLLSVFLVVNQIYFMGFFFFISGYFTPGSYERKGAGTFLKERLLRLGIPLLAFDLLLDPLTKYIGDGLPQPFQRFFSEYLLNFSGLARGPLWFVDVLLAFALAYVIWRKLKRNGEAAKQVTRPFPSVQAIALFVIGLAIVTFLTRIDRSIDVSKFGIVNFLLPLSMYPISAQYISLFVLGIMAHRYNWLATLPEKADKICLWVLLGSTTLLLIAFMTLNEKTAVYLQGGWHWQAFAWDLWECTFCVTMCIGLLVLFRRYCNTAGKLATWLSSNAYAVYVLHALIIVSLSYGLRGLNVYPLLKFVLVGIIALPLCFGISHLVRKLPLASKIL